MTSPPGERPVQIRRLDAEDAPAYKLLRDASLAAHPTAFTSDAAEEALKPAQSYLARFGSTAPGSFTLGAFDQATLVGAITADRESRAKVRHKVHITGMMVAAGHERRGIGRALLAACLATLRRTEGVALVTLSVTAGNDRAIDLYRSVGFERCGTLPRAIRVDGRDHAKDEMALLL